MSVLMIYPEFPASGVSGMLCGSPEKRAAHPPLGLLTVATMLARAWKVRLVDLNVPGLGPQDLAWAEIAFVSAMGVQRESTRSLIASCREEGVWVLQAFPR